MTPPSTNKAGFVPGQEWPILYPQSGDRRHHWRARRAGMVSYSAECRPKWLMLYCAGRHRIRSFIYRCTARHVRRPPWPTSAAAAGLPWHGHRMAAPARAAAGNSRRPTRPASTTASVRYGRRPMAAVRHGRHPPRLLPATGRRPTAQLPARHVLIITINNRELLLVVTYGVLVLIIVSYY